MLCWCEQSKEKLIASLKESPSSSGKSASDSAALVSELESVRQERDILQDELRSSQHTVDTVRSELAVSNTVGHFIFRWNQSLRPWSETRRKSERLKNGFRQIKVWSETKVSDQTFGLRL